MENLSFLGVPIFKHIRVIDFRYYILLTLLHSERPKLYAILAFLSVTGLMAAGA